MPWDLLPPLSTNGEDQIYLANDGDTFVFDRTYITPSKPKYDALYTLEDFQKVARGHATHIFGARRTLEDLLDRHEAAIRKKWKKLSIEKRRTILLDVNPHIQASHRPDFVAIRTSKTQTTMSLGAFLLPQISLEDLCKWKPLLLMINSRGRNPPYTFVSADSHSGHVEMVSRGSVPHWLGQHPMLFPSADVSDDYGKILDTSFHDDIT